MMRATLDSQMTSFNSLTARFQDDAFTFAYYMVGDESCAVRATGAAFARLSHQRQLKPASFRLEVLRKVLECCRGERIAVTGPRGSDDLPAKLQKLGTAERSAVVLVDVLGCSYEEAAGVLGCSTRQIMRLLARGRLGLGRGSLAM